MYLMNGPRDALQPVVGRVPVVTGSIRVSHNKKTLNTYLSVCLSVYYLFVHLSISLSIYLVVMRTSMGLMPLVKG